MPTPVRLARILCGLTVMLASGSLAAQSVAQSLAHTNDQTILTGNSVNCGQQGVHEDTGIWRTFDLAHFGITTAFCVRRIEFGIEEATAPCLQPVTVRLYSDVDSQPAPISDLTLLAERTVLVGNQVGTLLSVEIGATVPAQSVLVVEVFAPRGPPASSTRFLVGSNNLGESAPSYLRAPVCSVPEPVDLDSLGLLGVHVVLSAHGTLGACDCTGPAALSATQLAGSSQIELSWSNSNAYDTIELSIDGVVVQTVAGTTTAATVDATGMLGHAVEVEVRGLTGGVSCAGVAGTRVALVPPVPAATHTYTTSPHAGLAYGGVPLTSAIQVSDPLDVDTAQVSVEISHPVMADLVLHLTSPAGVTVTLHNNSFFAGGFFQPDLRVTYSDAGIPACYVSSSCQCLVRPFGPGTLADFRCNAFQGSWTLTALDLFPLNHGVLESWTLGLSPLVTQQCCPPLSGLTASSHCANDAVSLQWTAGSTYSAIEVYRDGALAALLTGSATATTIPSPGHGVHHYEVVAYCPNSTTATISAQAFHAAYAGQSDVILALEGLNSGGNAGLVDGAADLAAALLASGRDPIVVRLPPTEFDCFTDAQALWVLTGTFPHDYRLSAGECESLAAANVAGVALYLEGGDHWGFTHVVSALDQRDGVDAAAMQPDDDGDDSLTALDGQNSGLGLDLSDLSAVAYTQDQSGSDDNDRLVLKAPTASSVSESIWHNHPDFLPNPQVAETPYITGVLTRHASGADVIVQSWEIGGFGGSLPDLVGRYLAVLDGERPFRRGDCNDDSTINLADAITLLNHLFPQGPLVALHCQAACDANDDGTLNLSDAVSVLTVLFGGTGAQLPRPTACGLDPTADSLPCLLSAACP